MEKAFCRAFGLLSTLGAFACSPTLEAPPLPVAIDLIGELPTAEVVAETVGYDLLGSVRAIDGWGPLEHGNRGPFRWSSGSRSELDLVVFEPRALTLEIRARPFRAGPSESIRARGALVHLDGHVIGELELTPGVETLRLRVPGDAWGDPGRHRLVFSFDSVQRPIDAVKGSADERQLAMALHGLRLLDGSDEVADRRAPQPDLEGDRLRLSAGVQVEYFLEVGEQAELELADVGFQGGGRLAVLWQEEGGAEIILRELRREGRARVALPASTDGRRLVRLGLRSRRGSSVLSSPVVRMTALEKRSSGGEAALRRMTETPGSDEPANVLIYMIDTLRADRLGCLSQSPKGRSAPDLTRRIDEFASSAILFENAVAQSSWTKSSVASLLTGLWPPQHGALRRNHLLGEEMTTLPEILDAAGYETGGFVTNPNVIETFGFGQGYEEYTDLGISARSSEVTRAAVAWLERRDPDRPFFLYLHTLDPHSPYDPPAELRRRYAPGVEGSSEEMQKALNDFVAGRRAPDPDTVAGLVALYEAEVAANDRSFGALIDHLRRMGLYENTWVILVSDHGEEFLEHRHFRHGRTLFEESVRVPLIVKPARFPAAGGGVRVTTLVQHIDVVPTLLRRLGLPEPAGLAGRDLIGDLQPAPVFTYLHLDGSPRVAVSSGGWKLIQRLDGGALEGPRLYHLESDPGEQRDLVAVSPVRRGYLATLLRKRLLGDSVQAREVTLDPELRRRLEALGYI